RRFGHESMIHQRAFHLVGRDAMTGNVHDVVHAAQQPEISVFIHFAAVAGEIHAWVAGPVLLLVAIWIAVNRAHHGRPGAFEHKVTTRAGSHGVAFGVDDFGDNSGKRTC